MNKFFTLLKPAIILTFLAFFPQLLRAAPPLSFAGDPIFFLGPVGQSLGGATYSMKATHDNLLTNPAAGSFSGEYSADGTFSTAARTLGASVFDSKSTSYGGGLTYLRREVGGSDATKPLKAGTLPQTYQTVGLSLFGKIHESFAIGATGRYSMRSQTPLLPGGVNANGESWNGDVGAAFKLNEKIGFGAVYKNLFGDNKNVELTSLAGGAHFEFYEGVIATGSVEKFTNDSGTPKYGVPDDKKIAWALGAQYKHANGISVRAGFRDSGPWDSQIGIAGLGFAAEGFHANYAFATVTKGEKFTAHTFGIGATF